MHEGKVHGFPKSCKIIALLWIIYFLTCCGVLIFLMVNLKGSDLLGRILIYHLSLSSIIGFFVYLISQHILKGSELMKKLMDSEENYRTLAQKYEAVNRDLEQRIKEEVAKNRQKDHILIQQSRLAAMGEMIASIGHQWRQPLNSLSLLIQDVREALDFGEINDQYIDGFTRESMIQIKHMSRTINDFRKFYRPNKEKASFSISDAIEDALSIFSSSLKNHDIQVEFEYRGQQNAYGFANEYSQMVLNILTNSRDAFVANNITERKLLIAIHETDDFIAAEFTDNAGGIEPALLDKVFDPYFTTRPQGTGLGLYMSKMILENMGGSVKVENTGSGTRFSIYIPKVSASVVYELVELS